jgi:aldose 1-epimerase
MRRESNDAAERYVTLAALRRTARAMITLTDTIRLRAGDLEADFAPDRGMVATSLRHAGDELLDVAAGRSGIVGIPLLHPWANRLSAHEYAVDGRVVSLPAELLHCDEHGLPIHGVLAASPLWEVVEAGRTGLRARLEFRGELLDAFPFPHTLELAAALSPTRLAIATTVRAPEPMPIAFGYHPYLTLPGVPREEWVVGLPRRRHLELDARSIPTGRGELRLPRSFRLAEQGFDDGYEGIAPGSRFTLAGGGRELAVVFDAGYPVAQVYSPPSAPFICFEPMTAPTDALRSGAMLRRATAFTARFSIQISPSSRARPTACSRDDDPSFA